jgi:hypothetical protein
MHKEEKRQPMKIDAEVNDQHDVLTAASVFKWSCS